MGRNKAIMNPVQPSPWTSFAPLAYERRRQHQSSSQLLVKSYNTLIPPEREKVRTAQPHPHRDSLFRLLNRNTLILTFPNFTIRQIDTALDLCNNNLSEAMNILQNPKAIDRQRDNTRYIVPRLPKTSQNHTIQSILDTNKEITYIPTKYKDVRIVEINYSARPSNARVLTVPDSRRIVPFKNYNENEPILPRVLPRNNLTPPTTSPSSTSPQELDGQHVEFNTDKPEQKSMSPNQILERALTFYSPYPQDN